MRTIDGAGVPWSDVLRRFEAVLPRDPRTDPRARLVRRCGPPRLDPAEHRRWPLRLARAYRSAVAEWFGKCPHASPRWGLRRGQAGKRATQCEGRFCDVKDSLDASDVGAEVVALLRDAAARLHAAKIPHASWAAFSCAMWSAHGPRKKGRTFRPNVAWVYNAGRIDRRGAFKDSELGEGMEDWFDWYDGHFAGERVELLSEHRALFARWDKLCAALGCEPGATAERARELAWQHLPSEWYEAALDRIERARKRMEDEWAFKVDQDEWLWSRA